MKNIIFVVISTLLFNPVVALAKTLDICMDDDWPPYTFVKDKQIQSIDSDIITEAFKSLEYTLNIVPKPWKRCLKELEYGEVDAVFPASYKGNRAVFAHYPPDATTTKKSKWRMS